MVAQLDEDSMERVVYGLPDGPANLADRSRGIVSCGVQETDTYDHKRHSALKTLKRSPPPDVRLCEWDFVLECDDGTLVSLHPNYGNTTIACYKGAPANDHELPRTGKGGSNGPGTFKYFLNKNKGKTLKFDGQKRPRPNGLNPQSRDVHPPQQSSASFAALD